MRLVHSEAGEYFACAWQLGNRHMGGLRETECERTYAAMPQLAGGAVAMAAAEDSLVDVRARVAAAGEKRPRP